MLVNCDMDRAINYLLNTQDTVSTSGDLFQLAVLELIRKACRGSQSADGGVSRSASQLMQHKPKLLRILYNLKGCYFYTLQHLYQLLETAPSVGHHLFPLEGSGGGALSRVYKTWMYKNNSS